MNAPDNTNGTMDKSLKVLKDLSYFLLHDVKDPDEAINKIISGFKIATGAELTIIFGCHQGEKGQEGLHPKLLALTPEKGKKQLANELVKELGEKLCSLKGPQSVDIKAYPGIGKLLQQAGLANMVILPMLDENTTIGGLIVSGLPESYDIRVLTDENGMFISFFKLIVKYVLLYTKLGIESEREKEEQFRAVIEAAGDPIFVADFETGTIVLTNSAATKSTGFTSSELLKMKVSDLDPVFEPNKHRKKIWEKMVTGEVYSVEAQHKRKDGSVFTVDVRTGLFQYNNRKSVLGIARDITESKKLQENLERSVEQYRHLFNSMPFGGEVINRDGSIRYCSEKTFNILGYKPEELVGKHITSIISEEARELFKEKFPDILKGKSMSAEIQMVRKDGEKVDILRAAQPIIDQDGNVESILALNIDITKRKLGERKLTESEKKYRLVFTNSPLGIYMAKPDGTIIDVNPALLDILGSPSIEATKQINVLKFPPLVKNGYAEAFRDCVKSKNTRIFEVEYTSKWGKSSMLKSYIIPLVNESGDVETLFTIMEDVTEREKILTDLESAKLKAEESDRLKSSFLANMSHEIRTPMNGIIGFSDLLSDTTLSDNERSDYINVIKSSGNRLLETINELIDISKIEAGLSQISEEVVDLNELISELVKFFKPEAESKSLVLLHSCDTGYPDCKILADRNKLNSVLVNLIKNAIKFTDKGTITFGGMINGSFIEFYVKDTGRGMPQDKLDKIFQRFVQADMEKDRSYEGSGLGLAISKSYVELMKGRIWVTSTVGEGSTFSFTIPFKPFKGKARRVEAKVENEIKHEVHNINVLVAEDNEDSASLLALMLKKYVRKIEIVSNGREAVKHIKENTDTDLILMDIRMPEMNGYEATCKIREFNKNVKIIAQTAYAMPDDREKALEAGCDEYIYKPVSKEHLIELINNLI